MLVSILAPKNLPRSEPQQLSSAVEALRVRFGNRLVTSQAVRDQHAHTTTWIAACALTCAT
jgi:D-lactate dehydrogenase (cytochrome)